MSHADALIISVHAELAAAYAGGPRALSIGDEPCGDFGIAHATGVTADGVGHMTFDECYTPRRKTIRHEWAHLFTWRVGVTVLDLFLVARFGPGFVWDVASLNARASQMQAAAIAANDSAALFRSWQHWPLEIFAECFAAVTADERDAEYERWEMTEVFGQPLDDARRERMRDWYEDLRVPTVIPVMEVIDVDEATTRTIAREEASRLQADAIAQYANRLQVELVERAYEPIAEVQRRMIEAGHELAAVGRTLAEGEVTSGT